MEVIANVAVAGAAIAGLVLSLLALSQTKRGNQYMKEQADAASRQADAAEAANLRAERNLESEIQRILADAAHDTPAPRPRAGVNWEITRTGTIGYVLRNVGDEVATEVKVVTAHPLARGLPHQAVIHPGQSREFQIVATLGHPTPHEVEVLCDQEPTGRYVPLPVD